MLATLILISMESPQILLERSCKLLNPFKHLAGSTFPWKSALFAVSIFGYCLVSTSMLIGTGHTYINNAGPISRAQYDETQILRWQAAQVSTISPTSFRESGS